MLQHRAQVNSAVMTAITERVPIDIGVNHIACAGKAFHPKRQGRITLKPRPRLWRHTGLRQHRIVAIKRQHCRPSRRCSRRLHRIEGWRCRSLLRGQRGLVGLNYDLGNPSTPIPHLLDRLSQLWRLGCIQWQHYHPMQDPVSPVVGHGADLSNR